MSYHRYIKHFLVITLASVTLTSCKTKADSKTREQSFTIQQLYSKGKLPSTNEADRFVITGTIDEPDTVGGSFVVNTIDGDMVALTFHPEQMHALERTNFNAYLLKGNKVKCVGTKLDPGVFALLAAKITAQ